jgi:hypothetical protein
MQTIDADLIGAYRRYAKARRAFLETLQRANSCRDPLAELSERLVHRLLGGTAAVSRVKKGYDLVRSDGRRVQITYLANPAPKWVNHHHIRFDGRADDHALVIFEGMELIAILCFPREAIAEVCKRLGKRHPNQERSLQLTQLNYQAIIDDAGSFEKLNMRVYRPTVAELGDGMPLDSSTESCT